MLRVFFFSLLFWLAPLLGMGATSTLAHENFNTRKGASSRWLAQVDIAETPPSLGKSFDGGRRNLVDNKGLREAVKRRAISRDRKKTKSKVVTNRKDSDSSSKASPAPVGPSNRVKASNSNLGQKEKGDQERPKNQKYNFEFSKAEIMDVVKAISNMTGKNFIIPDKIKSQRITILSPVAISAAEAYQVFLSALEINGVTIVKAGKFLKLVDSKQAIKRPIPTCIGPQDDCPKYLERMVTRLIYLDHVEVSKINNVVKSLVSKGGQISLFQPSNALIISEYAPNLQRIIRIIEALDVVGFDDELQIVQIEYATATEIAEKLTQIFEIKASSKSNSLSRKQNKKIGSKGADEHSDVQISKIIADERTNQLVIKANRRSFAAIEGLLAKLDVPISDAEQGRVHVYYLNNAKAEDLASTLSSLAQGRTTSGGSKARGKTKGNPYQSSSAVLFEGELKISADKPTNSLIVVSSAHDYRALKKIIAQLDRPRRQVYVEAAILEVTTTNSDKAFTHWHVPGKHGDNVGFLQSGSFSVGDSGVSPTLFPTSGSSFNPANLFTLAGGSVAGIVGKSFTVPGTDITLPSFGVLLQWLQKDSNAQVLSTPHILTMDNEEASIEVGKKIPFQRGVSVGTSSLLAAAGGAGGGGISWAWWAWWPDVSNRPHRCEVEAFFNPSNNRV